MPIVNNELFDLAGAVASWTATGPGSPLGEVISNNYELSTTLYDIRGGQNFQIEAVMSSLLPGAPAEAGARLWARARFNTLAPFQYQTVQLRLQKELNNNDNFVGIYNIFDTLLTASGGGPARIVIPWDQDTPRWRIRLMRVGGQMQLNVESSAVFDDDPSSQTVSVNLEVANFPIQVGLMNLSELGFGNSLAGGNSDSTWESIHVTTANDLATPMPYWPSIPDTPTLTHVDGGLDSGSPQTVQAQVDLGPPGRYLANDESVLILVPGGTSFTANPSAVGLISQNIAVSDDSTVTGHCDVIDISGRTTHNPLPDALVNVPDRTSPLGTALITPNGGSIGPLLLSYHAANQPVEVGVDVAEPNLDTSGCTFDLNGTVQNFQAGLAGGQVQNPSPGRYVWNVLPAMADGTNTISIHLQDLEGNFTDMVEVFELDTSAPDALIRVSEDVPLVVGDFQPPAGPYSGPVFVGVQLSADDFDDLQWSDDIAVAVNSVMTIDIPGSGAADHPLNTGLQFDYLTDGATHILYFNSGLLTEGVHTVSFHLEDAAGNSRDLAPVMFTVDSTAPVGSLEINSDSGVNAGNWIALADGASLPSGTSQIAVRTTPITDLANLDLNASSIDLQEGANPPVNHSLVAATIGPDRLLLSPPLMVTTDGTYIATLNLVDNAGNPAAAVVVGFQVGINVSFYIDGSQGNSANAVTVSHTTDDGSALDAPIFLMGTSDRNYVGVDIYNSGTDPGDCRYRHFTIPATLFIGTTAWRLITLSEPAPTVVGVPAGGNLHSSNNVDFSNFPPGHPNFPSVGDPIWTTYASGDTLHTCSAVVLHSTADPLVLPSGPVSDADFDSVATFIASIMAQIDQYTGATGSYWQAVFNNVKIANRNMSFQNIGA